MVFLNYTTMQMTAKIVYYGPGLCGKTTNLQHIHKKTAPRSRGEMVSLETETDRTLFFDLLPLDVGVVGGMKVRLQLYTVPGQVFYNATRKLVLKNVDGVVFVADSQEPMLDANVEALRNLEENLAELGLRLDALPMVLQYNKRDLGNTLSVADLDRALNPRGLPAHEAAALHGVGVFETLKAISRTTLQSIRQQASSDADPRKLAPPPRPAAPVPPPATAATPLEHLVADAPRVEFAESDTGEHRVRPVETRPGDDIQRELERLRQIASAETTEGRPERPRRRLEDVAPGAAERPELRRKTRLQVPRRLLARAHTLRVNFAFETDAGEETVQEVVRVALPDTQRERGLRLEMDVDLRSE